jgi:hypothetical protein
MLKGLKNKFVKNTKKNTNKLQKEGNNLGVLEKTRKSGNNLGVLEKTRKSGNNLGILEKTRKSGNNLGILEKTRKSGNNLIDILERNIESGNILPLSLYKLVGTISGGHIPMIKRKDQNDSQYVIFSRNTYHLWNNKNYIQKPTELALITDAWAQFNQDEKYIQWSIDKYNTKLIFIRGSQECNKSRKANGHLFYLDKYFQLFCTAAEMTSEEMFNIVLCVQPEGTFNMDIIKLLFGDIILFDPEKLTTKKGAQVLKKYIELLEQIDKTIKEKEDLEFFIKKIKEKKIFDLLIETNNHQ